MESEALARHADAPAPGALLPEHNDMCFGCGRDHPAGLQMQLRAGEGLEVSGTARISALHQGAPGIAHGGVLAAVMDEALGSLNWLLRSPAVTANLNVNFLSPVPVERNLWLHARIVSVTGRKVRTEGSAYLDGPDGIECVSATGLFIAVDTEHFRRHGAATAKTP